MEDKDRQGLLRKLNAEMGDLVLSALDDSDVLDIMLNPDGKLWIERAGEDMKVVGDMSSINAQCMINTIAHLLNTEAHYENAIIEGELPFYNCRFEGLISPVVKNPTFVIRKHASKVYTLDEYVQNGIMTEAYKSMILEAVIARLNILIVGGTGSGKTTLLNAITLAISEAYPNDRIILIEDTREVQCSSANLVALQSTDSIDMLRLLKATLRLRPDRIMVGEVRGGEAHSLLKAWNTGHPGGVATVHANNAAAGLVRIEQLAMETGVTAGISGLVNEAVDLVVSIQKEGGREVREILDVKGKLKNNYKTIRKLDHENEAA